MLDFTIIEQPYVFLNFWFSYFLTLLNIVCEVVKDNVVYLLFPISSIHRLALLWRWRLVTLGYINYFAHNLFVFALPIYFPMRLCHFYLTFCPIYLSLSYPFLLNSHSSSLLRCIPSFCLFPLPDTLYPISLTPSLPLSILPSLPP